MVNYCCAFGCTNVYGMGSKPTLSFHRFPFKNAELLKRWTHALKRKNFTPSKTSVLCNEHFAPDCYVNPAAVRKKLKDDAVPSVFNFPDHLQPMVKQPRRELIQVQPENENDALYSCETCLQEQFQCDSTPVPNFLQCDTNPKEKAVQTDLTATQLQEMLGAYRREKHILQKKLARRNSTITRMQQLLGRIKSTRKSRR